MDESTIDMWLKTSSAEISTAEVALLESILPEIILAMMQAEELHVDD